MTELATRTPAPAPHVGWFPAVEPVRSGDVTDYVPRPHPALTPALGRSDVAAYLPFVAATFGVRVVVSASWTVGVEVVSGTWRAA